MDLQIGGKIKALRLSSELTQDELAARAKLTKGFISQLENDQCSISLDSLADILEALGVPISEFFVETDRNQVVFGPTERIPINGSGVSSFELLIPGSTNNMMDPSFIQLDPGQRLKWQSPHSGEQFGYVLSGTVTLTINKMKYEARKKHCFYFRADQPHQISNTSGSTASLLWVTSPPQM